MDLNQIQQFIAVLGFPIAACIAMGWYVKDNTKQHRAEVTTLNDQHREEMNGVIEAINKNTVAVEKLCNKLDTVLQYGGGAHGES